MKNIGFITPELRRFDGADRDSLLVLFRFAERVPLSGIASLVDWRLYGHLSRLVIDGFLTGDMGETLLMPTRRHLGIDRLLVVGIGAREDFTGNSYRAALGVMFDAAGKLGVGHFVTALPGRIEQHVDTATAVEGLLEIYDQMNMNSDFLIIEPVGAQKAMMPIVERWRLKQLVP